MELVQLVRKAQEGDKEAAHKLCMRFTGLVKKYAFQPHIRPIAEEAQAQGWLAVVEGIKQYDEKCGVQVAGYMESRVKYAIWNLFKRERRRWQQEAQLEGGEEEEGFTVLEQAASAVNVAEELEGKWLSQELMSALSTLPDKQRQVILRTVVGNGKLTHMAAELGITAQAVYNLRQRALARLKILCSGMYRDIRQ